LKPLAKAGSLVFGAAAAFFVAEVCLRLFFPQDVIKPLAIQLDPEIIYKLKPDTEAHFRGTSVRMYHLKTNSVGIREREIPFEKPGHVFRILLLGDSTSMGEGVELEETYLKQLGEILEANRIDNVETINAAIRGYGTDQELILFRRLGKRYNPDLVILAFFVYNDMQDNWEAGLFRLEDGKLIQQPATVEKSRKYENYVVNSRIQNLPGYSLIMDHSHLANWVRVTYAKLIRVNTDKEKKARQGARKVPLENQPAFPLTLAILEAWSRDARDINATPFLLMIPSRWDISTLRKAADADIPRLDLALERFCRMKDIPFLNLSSPMVKWEGDADTLWLKDGHLSPEGHRWVARELFEALRARDIFPSRYETVRE